MTWYSGCDSSKIEGMASTTSRQISDSFTRSINADMVVGVDRGKLCTSVGVINSSSTLLG